MPNSTYVNIAASPNSNSHSLQPVPPLLPFISDSHLLLTLPTIAYWIYGLLFYWIDQNGYLLRYRLHTPAELLKRNRVPMSRVIYSILLYQFVTTALGFWLMRNVEPDLRGTDDYDITKWTLRIGAVRNRLLILFHVSAYAIGTSSHIVPVKSSSEDPYLSGIRSWDMLAAKAIHWYLMPAFQFAVAIFVADTWQYFEHRLVHMNHYLYSECSNLCQQGRPMQASSLTPWKHS